MTLFRILVAVAIAVSACSAHAITFSEVVNGRSALDDLSEAEKEKYNAWAKEFARFYGGKDLNFLRTCSQESEPNPLCGLAQATLAQTRSLRSPLIPKHIRQAFYTAVSALDNSVSRRANCKSSAPKLEFVVQTSMASRLHARALYWLWSCSQLEVEARAGAEADANDEAEKLEASAEVERSQALTEALKAKEAEVAKLRAELTDAEKDVSSQDPSADSKLSSSEKRARAKVAALKLKLSRVLERKIDRESLKLSRELASKLSSARRKVADEGRLKAKAEVAMNRFSAELWKRFPFSYHTALSYSEEDERRVKLLSQNPIDPAVQEVSTVNPDYNPILRTLESLIKPGATPTQKRAAEALARTISREVAALEPRFRLYFSALLVRLAQSTPSVLLVSQNLAPLLRDYNEFIGAGTLKALFPLNYSVFDARKGMHRTIKELIENNKSREGLERMDPTILAALIYQESGFNPAAKSRAGAIGLVQMLLSTAKEEWQVRGAAQSTTGEVTVDQLKSLPINESRLKYDLARSLLLGSGYFEALRADFGGSYVLALAAYNSGPGTIQQWSSTRKFVDQQVLADLVLMDAERELHASDYVLSILAKAYWYHTLYFAE